MVSNHDPGASLKAVSEPSMGYQLEENGPLVPLIENADSVENMSFIGNLLQSRDIKL